MRIGVTGASGFVGRTLVPLLLARGHQVRALVRRPASLLGLPLGDGLSLAVVGEIGPGTDWGEALAGLDVVVHLAARVHVMRETVDDPLAAFRRVNVAGTERLVEAAVAAGVRRLVLVSTIKVLGESTNGRGPFRPDEAPRPTDPYAVSKHEAEQVLSRAAASGVLETVVVRPPLVHGPGAGGNLARLLSWLQRGWPLPLARLRNRRSLIGVDNLADLLEHCAVHPGAVGQAFLVRDNEDLSTTEILHELAAGLGRRARLFRVPPALPATAARLLGQAAVWQRLAGSLQVDDAETRHRLDWQPQVPIREGLRRLGRHR